MINSKREREMSKYLGGKNQQIIIKKLQMVKMKTSRGNKKFVKFRLKTAPKKKRGIEWFTERNS